MADVIPWTFPASDGYRWFYRHFPATGKPRARVVGIHGIQSHGGWYEASCRFLRDAGCDVYFLDRRGSGRNEMARGDMPSFRRLLDDIGEFLITLKTAGQPPLFVSAISWGGKLATGLSYRFPGLLDGMALLAPGFKPQVRPSRHERLRIGIASFVSPTKLFPVPLSDPALFTATPKWRKFLSEDPLAIREATARFFVESIKFDVYLRRAARHVQCPVLLMLAGEDRVIDNDRTRKYLDRFATADKTIIDYPAAHHTLEFEPDPTGSFQDLSRWILAKAGA